VPELLKQVYEAEMVYSARQLDGNLACDGTLLPGPAGKLGWVHGNNITTKKYLVVDFYTISLDCPNQTNPRSFQLKAFSNEGYVDAPRLTMDETGRLVVEPAPPKGPHIPSFRCLADHLGR
jgi:hypothetical protein